MFCSLNHWNPTLIVFCQVPVAQGKKEPHIHAQGAGKEKFSRHKQEN